MPCVPYVSLKNKMSQLSATLHAFTYWMQQSATSWYCKNMAETAVSGVFPLLYPLKMRVVSFHVALEREAKPSVSCGNEYLHIWDNHLKIWIRGFKHQSMKKWYSISIYWISRVASFSQIVSLTEAFLEASLRNYIILYYLFQTRIFLTGRPPSPTDPAPDVSYSYYPPSSSRSSCFGWLFSASSGFKLALGCSASWTSLI